jgi:hypothetical protein
MVPPPLPRASTPADPTASRAPQATAPREGQEDVTREWTIDEVILSYLAGESGD